MVQPYPPSSQQPASGLPTMYDLPSEDPEEPGLPDLFHDLQPTLLTQTCQTPLYPRPNCLMASDLDLYYDPDHLKWYKRPDWFLVVGVPAIETQEELRLSYLLWQERVRPLLVVELLSPGTEDEDLGRTVRKAERPPTKWQVYQDIVQIPYYLIYNRYDNQLIVFRLNGGRYERLELTEAKVWIEAIELGIGVWSGNYEGIEGLWLRFYDRNSEWIPTPSEQTQLERQRTELERQRAEQERQEKELEQQRAEQERQRAERERQRAFEAETALEAERRKNQELLARLQALGIDPNSL